MISLSASLAIIGTFLLIATYYQYGLQVKSDKSTPSIVTILLWLIEGIINFLTYWKSVGEIWQTVGTVATPLLTLYIFAICIYYKKFSKIELVEIASITFAIAVGLFWLISGNSEKSNLFIQAIYAISFLPIAGKIINGNRESPIAWYLATIAYIFLILSVLCNYQGKFISILFYAVNFLGNLFIVILIYCKFKKAE